MPVAWIAVIGSSFWSNSKVTSWRLPTAAGAACGGPAWSPECEAGPSVHVDRTKLVAPVYPVSAEPPKVNRPVDAGAFSVELDVEVEETAASAARAATSERASAGAMRVFTANR